MANEHFYVTSKYRWAVDESLNKAIKKLEKLDGEHVKEDGYKMEIWKVPLPIGSEYAIEWTIPQVEGVKLVTRVIY